MVQILPEVRTHAGILSDTLGPALGQGLGEFLGGYLANRSLEKVLSDKSYKGKDFGEKMESLETALRPHGERGERLFQKRLMVEQQRETTGKEARARKTSKQLAKQFGLEGEEFENLSPEQIIAYGKVKKEKEQSQKLASNIKSSLVKAGYHEETADLWESQFLSSPTGGQTDVIKQVNDLLRRSPKGKGFQPPQKDVSSEIEIPGIQNAKLNLDLPELPEPLNLTPSDMVKQQEAREKVLSPLYAETIDTLNALDEDFRDLTHMQDLNESGGLPTGIGKWNVNWNTGDLRVPALATPEAQDYVKTVARMLGHAKDFFPGRVTNFDLESFRRRFPTLANSPEGRRLIAKELELANRIAYLREETMKSAIEHYGSQADPVMVRKIANDNYRRLKGQLEGELRSLNKQTASMAPETSERKKVPQGTKITSEVVDNYLEMSNNDPVEAQRLAEEDGYVIE